MKWECLPWQLVAMATTCIAWVTGDNGFTTSQRMAIFNSLDHTKKRNEASSRPMTDTFGMALTTIRSLIYKSVRIPGSPFYERMSETPVPSWQQWQVRNDQSNAFTFAATKARFHVYDSHSGTAQMTSLLTKNDFARELGYCAGGFVRENRFVMDLVCDHGGFVVEYDPGSNDAYVTDKLVDTRWNWIPDRFGRSVPRGYRLWNGYGVSASPDGRHIYASTQENGVLIFERYGNIVIDLVDSSNLPMRRLDLLQIGDGKVQFGQESVTDGCLGSNSWTIDGVTYTVESSKWQEREEGSEWTAVDGTSVTSQLCTHVPKENREYRVVATMEIDGSTDEYSSNFFARVAYEEFDDLEVSSGEVEINGSRNIYCVRLFNTEIGGKNYTVFNSKWQSRPDENSTWSDVDGTETAGELCPRDASEDLEYRLVGSIMVDGERGHRQSNVMQVDNSD